MKIEFYKSVICPRCLYVSHTLKKAKTLYPNLEVEHIDIIRNLSRVRDAEIRTVPTLKVGQATLSGLFLTKDSINKFLAEHWRPDEPLSTS